MKEKLLDWNHVFLLAWYGTDGRLYPTTWMETEETRDNYITVVVTGPEVQKWGCPLWDAPSNNKPNPYGFPSHPYTEYQLHEVKPGEDAQEKAQELGGIKAIGWYFKKEFERKWQNEDPLIALANTE